LLAFSLSLVGCSSPSTPNAPGLPDETIPPTVTFTWHKPLEYTDGSPLFDLDGFNLYLNGSLYHSITDPGMVALTIEVGSGQYQAYLTAYNADGLESVPSNIVMFGVE